jgi:uncharacterized protein (DUF2235 family)
MALYAFDGTGNEDRDDDERDTNVVKFFAAYEDKEKDNDPDDELGSLYVKGIGRMARTFFGDSLAQAFGVGGHRRVRQALRRLRNNVRQGDTKIDVIGFSRGAGIAISFVNELAEEHPELKVRFMGLWDTVAQFGLPGERLQAGHDLTCPRNVERCYHALALDENRALFPLTRLLRDDKPVDGFIEAWFRGVHSDVGGGNGNNGLNWISLHWMFKAAQREGLPIPESEVQRNLLRKSKSTPLIRSHKVAADARRRVLETDCVHFSVDGIPPVLSADVLLRSRIDDAFALSAVAGQGM